MTLPANKIGDQGQRWEVRRINTDGEHEVMGWTDTFPCLLVEGAMLHPNSVGVVVIDRKRYRERRCKWTA